MKIFEPLTIGSVTFKNRLAVSGMLSGYAVDGAPSERFIRYYEEKAKGGWGLIITENYAIAPDGGVALGMAGVYNDQLTNAHKPFTDRIHAAGGKIICQLYHAGRVGLGSEITGHPPLGPSAVQDPTMSEIPAALTIPEIEALTEQFALSALNAKRAGFDGVELHGASGYLLGQFISPFSNKRSDAYGGDTTKRAKFATDIIKRIRELVGKDYPILYRLSVQEYVDGGLGLGEAKAVALLLEQAGVDLLHCTQGIMASRPYITPPYAIAKGSLIDNAAEIKKVVSIPVLAVGGRVNEPLMAESILRAGKADMVVMARASLADPYLPSKTAAGQSQDIIRCIGCVQGCQGGIARGEGIRCLVNPLTGREGDYVINPVPASQKKKIAVIGGGLSGCECALMVAKRGHQVTLYEKTDKLGGLWNLACVPLGKSDFASFVSWQQQQLKDLNVSIHFNTEITAAMLQENPPDEIVIATGGVPIIPPIAGLDSANAVLAQDVLSGRVNCGRKVLVIGGGLVGAETAEHLASLGHQVILVEMQQEIAKEAMPNPKQLLLESLRKHQVEMYTESTVSELNVRQAVIEQNGQKLFLEALDTVVIAAGYRSNPKMADNLFVSGCRIHLLGDANKVKDGYRNIQEGFELGISL